MVKEAIETPDVTWTHTFLDVFLHYVPNRLTTALDVGCGRGLVGSLLKIYREPDRIVGVDAFDPYLGFCKTLGVYNELLKFDVSKNPLPFESEEFDLAVALEVIEHLPKERGLDLLGELERVGRNVIVSTPNHFFPQAGYDENTFQRHLSRWTVRDLRGRGYTTIGVGGMMFFGREIGYLSYVLGRFTLFLPHLSSSIMGVYTDKGRPSHGPAGKGI